MKKFELRAAEAAALAGHRFPGVPFAMLRRDFLRTAGAMAAGLALPEALQAQSIPSQ